MSEGHSGSSRDVPGRKAPGRPDHLLFQWIGLRENLQETKDFPIKNGAFL